MTPPFAPLLPLLSTAFVLSIFEPSSPWQTTRSVTISIDHTSSPRSHWELKPPSSFHHPLRPSSTTFLPSEQPSCLWPSLVVHHIDLPFEFSNSRDGTTAAINQTSAPPTQSSLIAFDDVKAAGNATSREKMWVILIDVHVFWMNVTHPLTSQHRSAVCNQAAAPPFRAFLIAFDCRQIAGNAVGNAKRWVK